jgi:hypothetical protein
LIDWLTSSDWLLSLLRLMHGSLDGFTRVKHIEGTTKNREVREREDRQIYEQSRAELMNASFAHLLLTWSSEGNSLVMWCALFDFLSSLSLS